MKYPIYIPSKGRAGKSKTIKMFEAQGITDYYVVVEKKEKDEYLKYVPKSKLLVMKGSDYGTSTDARNFCIDHSMANGYKKHWQFDDDIAKAFEHDKGKTLPTQLNTMMIRMEGLSDSNKLAGAVGMRTANFLKQVGDAYTVNTSLTSIYLLTNYPLIRFRGTMIVDMDYQLQLLRRGYRTIKCQNYVFVFQTPLTQKGGYYDIYADDERRTAALNEFLDRNPEVGRTIHRSSAGYLTIKNLGQVWAKYKLKTI